MPDEKWSAVSIIRAGDTGLLKQFTHCLLFNTDLAPENLGPVIQKNI